MPKQGKYTDIITASKRIRDEIRRQMTSAGLTQASLLRELSGMGYNISDKSLSRFLSYGGHLPQRDVMLLCLRFGIVIKIDVFKEDVNKHNLKRRIANYIKKWSQDLSQ